MSLLKTYIIILYYSKHNHTKMLAKRIFDIFREFIPNDISITMMGATEMDIEKLKNAAGLIIGSPDYFGYVSGYIKIFFDECYEERAIFKHRPVFGFVTHGGGNKAGKSLTDLMKYYKMDIIEPCIAVKADNINSKIESQIQKNCLKMQKLIEERRKP